MDVIKIGISTFVTDETMCPQALGKAVEERGFDSLFLPEHTHIPLDRETPFPFGGALPTPYYRGWDPLVALAAVAVSTKSLRIGTGVTILVQRDVIQIAKEFSCLDILTNGRLIVGVGIGWNREEMRNHGVRPETRGALIDEQIEALKAIWSREEAEFHGRYVFFDPILQWPKPMQSPRPPIYVGGSSRAAARRAVQLGDGWMPIAVNDPKEVMKQIDMISLSEKSDHPITVLMAPRDPEVVAAYDDAGVERVTLFLPVKEKGQAFRRLDELAEFANKYGFSRDDAL